MNEVKPGWKTSEFWKGIVVQIVSLAALVGVVPHTDTSTVIGGLTGLVTAVFALLASGFQNWNYVKGRLIAKGILPAPTPPEPTPAPAPAPGPTVLPFLLAALLGALALWPLGSASAEPPRTNTTALLPWRRLMEERYKDKQPQSDPAMTAALQAIADTQRQILAELRQRTAPTPGPGPLAHAAPVEKHFYYLPIDSMPKQILPIDPAPKDKLPVDPVPKDKIPIDSKPKDKLPLDPGPKDKLPVDPRPPMEIGPGKTTAPPVGYQRFTIAPPPAVRFSDLPLRKE